MKSARIFQPGGACAAIGGYVVVTYNGLVSLKRRTEEAWSDIQVQMKRRYDLIPNLVETVKGYAAHEQAVLERVTRARTAAVSADKDPTAGPREQARREDELSGATRGLLAVAEAYPDLKASTNFLQLQHQLVETGDRLAAARRLYNLEVRGLNRRVEAFPSNIVAGMFSFTRAEYFELTDPAATTPPTVSL